MKKRWKDQADLMAAGVKERAGALIGVFLDDEEKADAFLKYWAENHQHVELIDRKTMLGVPFLRVKLKGSVQ